MWYVIIAIIVLITLFGFDFYKDKKTPVLQRIPQTIMYVILSCSWIVVLAYIVVIYGLVLLFNTELKENEK